MSLVHRALVFFKAYFSLQNPQMMRSRRALKLSMPRSKPYCHLALTLSNRYIISFNKACATLPRHLSQSKLWSTWRSSQSRPVVIGKEFPLCFPVLKTGMQLLIRFSMLRQSRLWPSRILLEAPCISSKMANCLLRSELCLAMLTATLLHTVLRSM